jgi:nitrate reductase gamma subunit
LILFTSRGTFRWYVRRRSFFSALRALELIHSTLAGTHFWAYVAGRDSDCASLCHLPRAWPAVPSSFADCAVLVVFSSLLQIVLYSSFAILCINIVSPNDREQSTISCMTAARRVTAFLGELAPALSLSRLMVLIIDRADHQSHSRLRLAASLSSAIHDGQRHR